ncbi:type 1 fimbrial protein [Pseudomonas lundensis]|nr:type 1 fimbrial protein [Pseudomonas lundensis]
MGCAISGMGWRQVVIVGWLGVPLLMPDTAGAADNLSFTGNLVAEACTIRPGDEALKLKFDDLSSHYLYVNTRTVGQPFSIHLVGCDTSIADSVTTTFSGVENTELPGLLALAAGSRARGIAIGLETLTDAALPLNTPSDKQTLSAGDNTIEFKAYVRGEPRAIAQHAIRAGLFSAVSTFTLGYP